MLEVTFAYLLATALLFAFRSTRWMGAVALFILLSVAPVLTSLMLVLVAFVGYHVYGKPRSDVRSRKFPWRD
jgi:hypothetical protein